MTNNVYTNSQSTTIERSLQLIYHMDADKCRLHLGMIINIVSFIDDFTRFTMLYFLREKYGACNTFIGCINDDQCRHKFTINDYRKISKTYPFKLT